MSSALQLISNTALSWHCIRIYSFVIPVSCVAAVSSNRTAPASSDTAINEFANISIHLQSKSVGVLLQHWTAKGKVPSPDSIWTLCISIGLEKKYLASWRHVTILTRIPRWLLHRDSPPRTPFKDRFMIPRVIVSLSCLRTGITSGITSATWTGLILFAGAVEEIWSLAWSVLFNVARLRFEGILWWVDGCNALEVGHGGDEGERLFEVEDDIGV